MKRLHIVLTSTLALAACQGDESAPDVAGSTSEASTSTGTTPTATGEQTGEGSGSTGGTGTGDDDGPWTPEDVLPTTDDLERGYLDRRGLIHTHSPYSHDACDGEPRGEDDTIDAVCLDDLRRGLCQTRHDFVMLTDHRDSFSRTDFPEVLLFDEGRGDNLVERGGNPVANWTGCDDVDPVLVMAGTESAVMPVGLESHVPGRGETYGEFTMESVAAFKDHGAVVILQHTEEWNLTDIIDMPVDGFEMYNVHANMFLAIAEAAALVTMAQNGAPGLPHSDLALFPIWREDPIYLATWGSVLATGTRRVGTMGTDAHRNTLPQELPDGERIDSFRRMMKWFSNHLLVQPEADGSWDDRHVKEALREGRLYGAFEYLGYPGGFDAYATTPERTVEIGAEIPLGEGPEIVAVAPVLRNLDPGVEAPSITLHLLHAIDGGFEEVAEGTDELRFMPEQAGAYRVEVRITPRHLRGYLGDFADGADTPRVWIYANPFYVR